jgi:hypothetical protein
LRDLPALAGRVYVSTATRHSGPWRRRGCVPCGLCSRPGSSWCGSALTGPLPGAGSGRHRRGWLAVVLRNLWEVTHANSSASERMPASSVSSSNRARPGRIQRFVDDLGGPDLTHLAARCRPADERPVEPCARCVGRETRRSSRERLASQAASPAAIWLQAWIVPTLEGVGLVLPAPFSPEDAPSLYL